MGGVSSVLKTEWNNICVGNFSDQSARKNQENFSTEIEEQIHLYPVPKSNNTEYVSSQVRNAMCKCLFRNPSAVIFLMYV
jgi:hypothetical protein